MATAAALEFMQKYDFSTDELLTVVDAFKKHQLREMSDKDFAELIGTAIANSGGFNN